MVKALNSFQGVLGRHHGQRYKPHSLIKVNQRKKITQSDSTSTDVLNSEDKKDDLLTQRPGYQ